MKTRIVTQRNKTAWQLSSLVASLGVLVSCAGLTAEKDAATDISASKPTPMEAPARPTAATKPPTKTASNEPANTDSDFEGCDSPVRLSRADRLAILEKVSLEAENLIASEAEATSSESTEEKDQRRLRIRTFAAGLMPDTVRFVSMDRSCWASFFGAKEKLVNGDEIGALSEAKEWKDCLNAHFPDRIAIAKPYFSCFQSAPDKPEN